MTYFLYKHFDKNDELLYVGRTINLRTRAYAHRTTSPWFGEVARTESRRFYKKKLAANAEFLAILYLRPKYNKMHNLWLNKEKFPYSPTKTILKLIASVK